MFDSEMVEQIEEELVMLSLIKDTDSYKSDLKFAFYVSRRPLFVIQLKLRKNKVYYTTFYKGRTIPALETADTVKVVDQVKKWIEVETMKG